MNKFLALFIAYVAGVIIGRVTTRWKLEHAVRLLKEANDILKRAQVLKEQIDIYEKQQK